MTHPALYKLGKGLQVDIEPLFQDDTAQIMRQTSILQTSGRSKCCFARGCAGLRGTKLPHPFRTSPSKREMLSIRRLISRQSVSNIHKLQRCSIYFATEPTPNANSLKFLPGETVLPESFGTGLDFQRNMDKKEIRKSPLVKALFEYPPVAGVFIGRDFITVTKATNEQWTYVRPRVFSILMDFYNSDEPIMRTDSDPTVQDTAITADDSEIVQAIKELIETRVRPSVQEDGGDIFYVGFDTETGLVSVRLAGSCVGCPSSSITLRNGVENMLMHYIPEVKGIVEVTASADGTGTGDVEADKELKLHHVPTTSAESV